jgi:hypothetical protein
MIFPVVRIEVRGPWENAVEAEAYGVHCLQSADIVGQRTRQYCAGDYPESEIAPGSP